MGKQVVTTTTYVSDLTEEEVFTTLETITGAIDGEKFKLEVTPEEAKTAREAFAPYLAAARRMKGENGANPTHVQTDAKTMRISLQAWGVEGVPQKGRLSPEWVEKYNTLAAEKAGEKADA